MNVTLSLTQTNLTTLLSQPCRLVVCSAVGGQFLYEKVDPQAACKDAYGFFQVWRWRLPGSGNKDGLASLMVTFVMMSRELGEGGMLPSAVITSLWVLMRELY
jgi:hypothetical protein